MSQLGAGRLLVRRCLLLRSWAWAIKSQNPRLLILQDQTLPIIQRWSLLQIWPAMSIFARALLKRQEPLLLVDPGHEFIPFISSPSDQKLRLRKEDPCLDLVKWYQLQRPPVLQEAPHFCKTPLIQVFKYSLNFNNYITPIHPLPTHSSIPSTYIRLKYFNNYFFDWFIGSLTF